MLRTDEQIKKDVVDQLFWDSRLDAANIDAEVVGGTVVLKGSVDDYFSKRVAGIDAQSIKGVRQVDNQLRIRGTTPATAREEILDRVEQVLAVHSEVNLHSLRVFMEGDVLFLEGVVDAYWKKQLAEELAYQVQGATEVENRIGVTPATGGGDEIIARNVLEALRRRDQLAAESVDVRVEDGRVRLSGSVPTWMARNAAYEAALYTDGVVEVEENLSVEEIY